jgi:hypothetical protein
MIAARMDEQPVADVLALPGWHIERARRSKAREVDVELVVNGVAADKTTIVADGTPRPVQFKVRVSRSSWVALRILPSGHTHPIFVTVDRKPVRASRRSAQWCRASVDKLWAVKSPYIRESERGTAAKAYDHARVAYEAITRESDVE